MNGNFDTIIIHVMTEENALSLLKQHIQKRVPQITGEALTELSDAFLIKKIKKKQFIIQPEFTARYRTLVLEGAFRSYVIDKDGIDHTIQFALEDWYISDINSYLYQKPATMFVAALEDSTVAQMEFNKEQELKKSNHVFETYFRIGADRTAAYHQRRIISSLTQTAEERYHEFVQQYPHAVQRLPQYALASYLGMTTQFLSRIRKKMMQKS